MSKPARLLFVHAGEDDVWRHSLESHLSSLSREGYIDSWHVGLLPAGAVVDEHLTEEIARADVVLLLLSADFMASVQCQAVFTQLHTESASRFLRVVPVLIRPVDITSLALQGPSILPRSGRAVSVWADRDEAWVSVVHSIRQLLTESGLPKPAALASGQDLLDTRRASRSALRIAPGQTFLRTRQLIEEKKLSDADRELAQLPRRARDSAAYWYWRACVAFALQNWDVASAYIEAALRLDARHRPSLVLRIKLLLLRPAPERDQDLAQVRRSYGLSEELDAWIRCLIESGMFQTGACSDIEIETKCPSPVPTEPSND